MKEIKARIKNFILDSSFRSEKEIFDDTMIFEEGYFDSMGFVSLITFLEEEFNILPDDGDLTEENFKSINAISTFVEKNLQLIS